MVGLVLKRIRRFFFVEIVGMIDCGGGYLRWECEKFILSKW